MFEGERYLTSEELCSILKISRRTLQYYRDDGIFPFIQLPGKVLFRESDIKKVWKIGFRSAYNIEDLFFLAFNIMKIDKRLPSEWIG